MKVLDFWMMFLIFYVVAGYEKMNKKEMEREKRIG